MFHLFSTSPQPLDDAAETEKLKQEHRYTTPWFPVGSLLLVLPKPGFPCPTFLATGYDHLIVWPLFNVLFKKCLILKFNLTASYLYFFELIFSGHAESTISDLYLPLNVWS